MIAAANGEPPRLKKIDSHSPPHLRRAQWVLGTLVEITAVHSQNAVQTNSCLSRVFEQMRMLENELNPVSKTSAVGKLNQFLARASSDAELNIPFHLGALLFQAKQLERESELIFSPVKPLGDSTRRTWTIERKKKDWVVQASPDIQFELGGIAKGYILDQVASTAAFWGADEIWINAGGDLCRLHFQSREGQSLKCDDSWKVWVRNPLTPMSAAIEIDVNGKFPFVATSARSPETEEWPFHSQSRPFWNGRSRAVTAGHGSVTVAASKGVLADALTKIYWNLLQWSTDETELEAFLQKWEAQVWLWPVS